MKLNKTYIVLIIAAIMLPVSCTFAQTQKGNILPGGSADASLSYNGATRSFNVSLQPLIAKFVLNNFAVGAIYSIGISGSHALTSANIYKETNTFTTSLGPYLKYYIGKKALKGAISANAAYLISSGIRTETNRSPAQTYEGFTVGGTVGLAYFFNPHLALEPALYINATGYTTQLPTTRFGFSLGLFAFLERAKPKMAK